VLVTVMGFIMLGIATPSEAAATGVLGALGVAAFYGRLSWRMIGESLAAAASIATVILVIMASSKLFSQLLAFTGGTAALTNAVVDLGLSSWAMLIVLMAFPFVLCMFIDQIALMLVIIPIYQPLLPSFGFDPIWFWLLFLINITVGGMTPPFGYTLFALKGASDISITQLYACAWPFVGLYLAGMVILALAPGIVTYLPSLF
jgi:TRAP-type mannitol/chloroaromatic compound transport system permease large subunit